MMLLLQRSFNLILFHQGSSSVIAQKIDASDFQHTLSAMEILGISVSIYVYMNTFCVPILLDYYHTLSVHIELYVYGSMPVHALVIKFRFVLFKR